MKGSYAKGLLNLWEFPRTNEPGEGSFDFSIFIFLIIFRFLTNFSRFEIGCGHQLTCPTTQPHKIIELSSFLSPALIAEATKMYGSGLSLRSISVKLDIPKTSLRDILLSSGVTLRAHSRQPYQFTGIAKEVSIRNAPYGFCLVDGRLIPDPREQKIVQLILDWSQKGMSHGDIARKLNDKKLSPRKADLWKQPLVSIIIKRHKEQPKNGGLK